MILRRGSRYLEPMSASLKLPVHMTVEEFFAWDPGDGQRYELVEGAPRAMALEPARSRRLQAESCRRTGQSSA